MPITSPRPEVRSLASLLFAVILLGTATSACGDGTSTGDKGYVDGEGIITRLTAGDRRTPGDVTGTALDGRALSLKQYAGKAIVLNVWGSWCSPCRKEARLLAGAARELEKDGVAFVGVNTKDASPDQGLAFEKRYDVPYPSFYDPSGRTLLAFRGTLIPSAIPSTVVIDPHGQVAASIQGPVPSQQTLVDLVRDVVK
jgi:thiol-disulfide isomerase/thioredoxin